MKGKAGRIIFLSMTVAFVLRSEKFYENVYSIESTAATRNATYSRASYIAAAVCNRLSLKKIHKINLISGYRSGKVLRVVS